MGPVRQSEVLLMLMYLTGELLILLLLLQLQVLLRQRDCAVVGTLSETLEERVEFWRAHCC